jgi:hydrogenase expression/formation protein HypE
MAHGAGGKDSSDLMREIFGRHFANPALERMEDASPINLRGGSACVSTDSFVVTPVEFPGGDIGKLAVCGSVNDVLMMGATPKFLTCGYILEEGLSMQTLDRVAASMAEAARGAGVIIVAGDTKVIERRGGSGEASGLMINTMCIGEFDPSRACEITAANAKPRDAIIVSGTLGDHHACILSARMGVKNGIKSDCAVLAQVTRALLDGGIDVHVMRDITRGGLATVLNEIAASSGVGIEIEENSIPENPEVKAFCGIMGLDPLYMGNEGKLAVFVGEADAARALEIMRNTELGRNARIIGRVAESRGDLGRACEEVNSIIGNSVNAYGNKENEQEENNLTIRENSNARNCEKGGGAENYSIIEKKSKTGSNEEMMRKENYLNYGNKLHKRYDEAINAENNNPKTYANGNAGEILTANFGAPAVRMRTRLGGTRRIDMLVGEGLPRIC